MRCLLVRHGAGRVYGISARKRARLIAVVSWRWKNARVPVRRAGVILPFSPMKSRKVSMSL